MCNCFDEILGRITKDTHDRLKDVPLVHDTLKIDWEGRVFFLDGGCNAPVSLKVKTEYRPLKKDGTPAKSLKKRETGVRMSHCPFCGEKYE